MRKPSVFRLALLAMAFAACQSNSFKIEGTTEGLQEGDTLFLTTGVENGVPSDTLFVKDGKFGLSGETDTLYFCLIYSPGGKFEAQPLFIEPGTIRVHLSSHQGSSKISGTRVHDDFQALNDSAAKMSQRFMALAQKYDGQVTDSQKAEIERQVLQAQQSLTQCMYRTAERNIDNELGYMIVTSGADFDNEQVLKLINKMPPRFRNRELIKEIEYEIKTYPSESSQATFPDISLNDEKGQPHRILDEISKYELTIIDYWASWCRPCMMAMPDMVALYDAYKDKGLGLIGISLDNDAKGWKEAIKATGAKWLQLSDLKGWESEPARLMNVRAIPHTVVMDKEGKILQQGLSGPSLLEYIENTFSEGL